MVSERERPQAVSYGRKRASGDVSKAGSSHPHPPVVVLAGSVTLQLEDGEALLHAGDVAIQRGTLHAWHNRSDTPVTFFAVMVSASLPVVGGGQLGAELPEVWRSSV